VKIETVQNPKQGIKVAKHLLYKTVDPKTVLFLSGGTTPKPLYKALAQEKKLHVGAVAMVDERYGVPLHKNSNERMIKESGFLDYFKKIQVPFYPILRLHRHSGKGVTEGTPAPRIFMVQRDSGQARLAGALASRLASRRSGRSGRSGRSSGLASLAVRLVSARRESRRAKRVRMTLEETQRNYEKVVHHLFLTFSKRIAIMGIGEDGHTASLRAGTQNSSVRQAQDDPESIEGSKLKTQKYVIGISDFPGELKERITLTFKALSEMNLLIVLVFGSSKKNALNLMLTQGLEEEIPARFFNLPDVSRKTIVITDQKI
jgi:6-phosphogluconolactonase/glucosamine-6-phosphate isomerase/deaminase